MKKLVCLDMDGTIYLGNKLFDGVKELFKFFEDNQIKYIFLTNNSSKSKSQYVEKLAKLGIESTEDNFYTSIDVTIKYLLEHNYKNVCALGVKSFKDELKKQFNVIETYSKDTKVDVVLASFDTELTYTELRAACMYLQDGASFIATNMDYRCPIENGYYIPDCGGLCEWMKLCTGVTPTFLGKPEPTMIEQVIENFHLTKEDVIMVGDRFYTDIQAGINAGVDTLAVLSGESTLEDFKQMKKQPTYIRESIADLIDILKNN